MKIKTTLKFFREYFRIPEKVHLRWCMIRENYNGMLLKRLGVELVGTGKAIDVLRRCFIEKDADGIYQFVSATRVSKGKNYVFVCEDRLEVEVPKTLVRDIYFRSVYSPEMMKQVLL